MPASRVSLTAHDTYDPPPWGILPACKKFSRFVPIDRLAATEVWLLDHVIRPLQERRRDRQAESLGGVEVDDEFELRGLGRSSGLAPLRILST